MRIVAPFLCDWGERPRAAVDHCCGNDAELFPILVAIGDAGRSLPAPPGEVISDDSFVAQRVLGFVELVL